MKPPVLLTLFLSIYLHGYTRANSTCSDTAPIWYSDTVRAENRSIESLLSDILRVTGLQSNFDLKEGKVSNIEAFISHRKRYILYNPNFLSRIEQAANDRWSTLALLAHEVGHHLNGHTIRRGGSKPGVELEADEFAGFILHRLGATLQQAKSVMFYIAGEKASSTHPDRAARLAAIGKGWNRAAE